MHRSARAEPPAARPVGPRKMSSDGLFACPGCRQAVTPAEKPFACPACRRTFAVRAGIPLMAEGSAFADANQRPEACSIRYQQRYLAPTAARQYHDVYTARWSKRRATRQEHRRLRQLLALVPTTRRMLDLPCGAGRMRAPLAAHTDVLLQADISLEQVLQARATAGADSTGIWFTASAFQIPLRDAAVDGSVCNRLSHHLPAADERAALVGELLRVSRAFVILMYYDRFSLKCLGRWIRRRSLGNCLSRRQVRALAAQHGARVRADRPLWGPGSRFRYALLSTGCDD